MSFGWWDCFQAARVSRFQQFLMFYLMLVCWWGGRGEGPHGRLVVPAVAGGSGARSGAQGEQSGGDAGLQRLLVGLEALVRQLKGGESPAMGPAAA